MKKYEQAQTILYLEAPLIKTPVYEEFCILRSEVEKQEVALAEMKKKLQGLPASPEHNVLRSEIDALQQICTEKQEALEALDRAHSLKTAEDIVDKAERLINEVPDSVRAMLDTMEIFEIADPVSNIKHVVCSFFPSRLAEDNWVPLKLTREDIVRSADESEDVTNAANEIDYSQIDSIELEIQAVKCDRPWLWKRLFKNEQWDWETPSPPISTGSQDWGKDDMIPAFIYALFFYRNLTVKTRPSGQPAVDMEKLRHVLASSLLLHVATPLTQSPQPRPGQVIVPIIATIAQPLGNRSMKAPILKRDQPNAPGQIEFPGNSPRREFGFTRLNEILGRGFIRNLAGKGRVVDESGVGIYQAFVTLEGNSGKRRVRTGQDGHFTFPTLAPGLYRVHVEKAGFTPFAGSIKVPQSTPEIIRMSPAATCQVVVRLQLNEGEPFVGAAKVLIQSKDGQRVESMDQRSEAIFPLPPGDFTISVTSPEAERISPPNATVKVLADCSEHPRLTFTISSASVLRTPDVSLLCIVCQKVPRSPHPRP